MQDPEFAAALKALGGVSDEDLAKIGPEHEAALKAGTENAMKYKLVFEVVKSKNCLYGVKKGQKIVINGSAINTVESDCPLCMGLVGPLLPLTIVYYDRCMTGNVKDPMPEGVRCIDPGLDCPELHGLGSVYMTAKIEPVA
jgi:hypothetical protein